MKELSERNGMHPSISWSDPYGKRRVFNLSFCSCANAILTGLSLDSLNGLKSNKRGISIIAGTKYYRSTVIAITNDPFDGYVYNLECEGDHTFIADGFAVHNCAYTDEKLPASQLNIDHVIPKSRGGRDTWENLVACRKDINFKKGNKTNKEAGLSLKRKPKALNAVPKSATIREVKRPEHAPFIK